MFFIFQESDLIIYNVFIYQKSIWYKMIYLQVHTYYVNMITEASSGTEMTFFKNQNSKLELF